MLTNRGRQEVSPKYNRAAHSRYKAFRSIKMQNDERELLIKAIELAGSKAELSRQTGIHVETFYGWQVHKNVPQAEKIKLVQKYVDKMEKQDAELQSTPQTK